MVGIGAAQVCRLLPAQAAVAQQRLHRGRVKGRQHAVVLPEQHRASRAGAVIGQIGILDKVGIKRGQIQVFHLSKQTARGWSLQGRICNLAQ